jgi:hypothetical protein
MTDSPDNTTRHNTARYDPPDADARIRIARFLIERFAVQFTADIWNILDAAFSDTPALSAEITRLRSELDGARLDRANLAGAGLAAIAAHRNGEPDPLWYLRDELRAQGYDTTDWGRR